MRGNYASRELPRSSAGHTQLQAVGGRINKRTKTDDLSIIIIVLLMKEVNNHGGLSPFITPKVAPDCSIPPQSEHNSLRKKSLHRPLNHYTI